VKKPQIRRTKMNRRIFAISVMVTMVSIILCGLSVLAEAQETQKVTIGIVAEMTGSGASTGSFWERGVLMAIEEINAAGGILGRKVETFTLDTKSEAPTGIAVMRKAIERKPYVVMGSCYSGITIVNMPILQEAGIPQFTPAESPEITRRGNPNIFRTSYSADLSMQKVVKWITEGLKVKKMAIIYANDEFGRGGRDALVKLLESKDVKIVVNLGTDFGQADYTGELVRAKASGADALFIYLHEEEGGRILPQARQMGVDKVMEIIGHATLIGPETVRLAGKAAEGIPGFVDMSHEAKTFKPVADKYEKKYGKVPDHNFFKAYIGTYVVKATAETVGSFDQQKFRDTLHNRTLCVKNHPGVLADIHYDEKGDIDRESFLVKIQEGKQVITGTLGPLHPEWFTQCKK
jgi:branched-chain amino acid transport system substrate-binding protein